MLLSCQSIPSDSIKFSPDWNLHPWEFRVIPPELQEAFSVTGVIHPPLVIADSAKSYILVAGSRRVEFIKQFSRPSQIDCMVLVKDISAKLILDFILTDQRSASDLTLAEKARFVEIASRTLPMDEIVSSFGPKLQLKNERTAIPKLLEVMNQDETIVKEIHGGRIQDRMVWELLTLPERTDRLALVHLFSTLGMGDGKQRRFFNLIRDITFREETSISSYLQKPAIAEILYHSEMNIPQKIHNLGNYLQQELNPHSSLAEENFTKEVKNWKIPPNYTIAHSPFFEKDEVTLTISFDNLAACKQYLNRGQWAVP